MNTSTHPRPLENDTVKLAGLRLCLEQMAEQHGCILHTRCLTGASRDATAYRQNSVESFKRGSSTK